MKVAGLARSALTSPTFADAAEKARCDFGARVSSPWSSPSPKPGFAQRRKAFEQLPLRGRSCAAVFIGIALLLTACTNAPPEATAVADQFIRAYFAEDNVAGAAKLASGAVKTRLDGVLQQIEATGLKEPTKDKPRVKVTLVETQPVSANAIGYVYRIDSETPGIQPITAKLRLSKDGNAWRVSEFVQSP